MGKECGAWVSRRFWRGGNTSPLKTTAWSLELSHDATKYFCISRHRPFINCNAIIVLLVTPPQAIVCLV